MGWERYGYTSDGYTPFSTILFSIVGLIFIVVTIIKAWM